MISWRGFPIPASSSHPARPKRQRRLDDDDDDDEQQVELVVTDYWTQRFRATQDRRLSVQQRKEALARLTIPELQKNLQANFDSVERRIEVHMQRSLHSY